jgi:CRISPR-associated protein Cas1
MKQLLNTIYITKQGAYCFKERQTMVVEAEKKKLAKIPIHTMEGLVLFGNVLVSPWLLALCAENDVTVSYLSEYGRFLARVNGPVSGNVLLSRTQYRYADDPGKSLEIARNILLGKISNLRTVLRRALRDHAERINAEKVEEAANSLRRCISSVQESQNIDEMRGHEGEAARKYFSVFDEMILRNEKEFTFYKRTRRPPLDSVNCLLSFFYTILMHDARSALEAVGLDPAVGYLHRDRPGRFGLALDMMEELRPVIADRLALSLLNRKQLSQSDFRKTESRAVLLTDRSRKTTLVAYQNKKKELILHPFLNEKIEIGLLLHAQALLLSRYLRGDIDGYPCLFWR